MDDTERVEAMIYEPPTIEDVPLRADEVVVAGCKTLSGISPGQGGGAPCLACNTASPS